MSPSPWTWVSLLLLTVLVNTCQGQQIMLTVQPNVTANVSVCPNSTVVFTCDASGVGVLIWRINGTEFETFTSSSVVDATRTEGQFTALLISNQQIQGSAARNYLSTLTVQSVSDLDVGSVIECLDDDPSLRSINVNYTLIGTPPTPSPTVSVTRSQDDSSSIILTFNAAKDVDMYSLIVSGDQGVNCPSTCNPGGTCMCTGLVPGDGVMVNISISAVNCDTQIGPTYDISFTPRVPDVPSSCWIVPVYSALVMGPRIGVVAMWSNVSNPPYLANELSQNVLNYSVSVSGEMIQVPVETACLMDRTCLADLDSYYSNTSFDVSVAAVNLFGNGSIQTCEVPSIRPMNTIFNIVVDESGRTVQCDILDQDLSNIVCQFCYGANDCDNSLTCVNVTTTNQLRNISEGTTYCYRVTAFLNGVPIALIKDSFTASALSDTRASWLIPLLSISVICICSVVLVIVAMIIIIIIIFRMRQSNVESSTVKDQIKSLCLVDASGIIAIILSIVTMMTLLLSIILLIAHGATANGYLVAAAFPFSLVALVSSIALLAVEVHHKCKMDITEPVNRHRGQDP